MNKKGQNFSFSKIGAPAIALICSLILVLLDKTLWAALFLIAAIVLGILMYR